MKDYATYTLDDYLSDPFFKDWVRGKTQEKDWPRILKDNPGQTRIAQQARQLLLATAVKESDLPEGYIETIIGNTLDEIHRQKKIKPVWPLHRLRPFMVAASVALLILAGLWYRHNLTPAIKLAAQKDTPASLIQKSNKSDQVMPVVLPDGSSVLLQPRSNIRYPNAFDPHERIVYLSGEAFFEVTKDPEKPFYVYANELVTKVVGTSFTVSAFAERASFEVIVKTGKVNVYTVQQQNPEPTSSSVQLNPNQQVIFNRRELSLIRSEVSPMEITSTPDTETSYTFNDTPVRTILHRLSQEYKIPIQFDENLLSDCALTTVLVDEPLFIKLKTICEAVGPSTSYTVINNAIVINSKGCNQ